MKKNDYKLIIFLMFSFLSFLLLYGGYEEIVIGETPCVDGLNRINLEGIMCEDIDYTWFGLNQWWVILSFIPILLGMVIYCKIK